MIPEDKIYSFADLKREFKQYILKPKDQQMIEEAYNFAKEKHEGQKRRSGQPYITHPVAVAYFLAKLRTGPETIAAGLLHDTVEDTDTKNSELATRFGPTVAYLVEALTKIADVTHKHSMHILAEDHRKIFVAMAKDVRVIIIKLCDRLHNISTLQYQPHDKQIRIAQETLDVYAPIAHRLGLYNMQIQLEDLSLYYLKPQEYEKIAKQLAAKHESLTKALNKLSARIDQILQPTKIPFQISSRVKSIYSIYKKTVAGYSFDEIYDIMALRVITQSENQCYEILGYIHANFKPIPGRFKDYIAMPKPNLYQSLHTTIITESGHVFEIQIRTKAMDETAEEGVAAHWRYKEGETYNPKKEQEEIENQLHWFRDFVSITDDSGSTASAQEYVDTLQHDIFDANVYVFTPLGKVLCLPKGATVIDFAYRIHTDVGNTIVGAKINGAWVPLSTTLKTGDICEIKTSKDAHPNPAWLKMCVSSFAKSHIRKYLTKVNSDYVEKDQVAKARQSLTDALRERKINADISVFLSKKVLEHFKYKSEKDFLLALYAKNLTPQVLIDYLGLSAGGDNLAVELTKSAHRVRHLKTVDDAVLLTDGDRAMMVLAACCRPIPGDPIVGYISKGNGLRVHRKNCPNIEHAKDRIAAVKWNDQALKSLHPVDLSILCRERENLVVDIVNTLSALKINVTRLSTRLLRQIGRALVAVTVMVTDVDSLIQVENALKSIKDVEQINRVTH